MGQNSEMKEWITLESFFKLNKIIKNNIGFFYLLLGTTVQEKVSFTLKLSDDKSSDASVLFPSKEFENNE